MAQELERQLGVYYSESITSRHLMDSEVADLMNQLEAEKEKNVKIQQLLESEVRKSAKAHVQQAAAETNFATQLARASEMSKQLEDTQADMLSQVPF